MLYHLSVVCLSGKGDTSDSESQQDRSAAEPLGLLQIVGVCLGQAMSEDAARILQPFLQIAGSYINRLAFDDSDLMVASQRWEKLLGSLFGPCYA